MKEKGRLKVLVIEDDAVIALLIETDLNAVGHHVVGIVNDGAKALTAIHKNKPDLVILDIDLGGDIDGIDIGLKLNQNYATPFIYLTAFSDNATLDRAKESNPCGYIVKPYKPNDLYAAITIGMFNFENRKTGRVLKRDYVNSIASDSLTEREFDIIEELISGLTNAQIATKQHLSLNTIKWHLQNIYSKMGVKNRTSLVQMVFTDG